MISPNDRKFRNIAVYHKLVFCLYRFNHNRNKTLGLVKCSQHLAA